METAEKSWKCCCCSLGGFPFPEEIPEYAGGNISPLFSLVAGCPSLKNDGNWGGRNLLGTCMSHHCFSVYRAPVLFLKGKVLGKPLPSAHHISVPLQRRTSGFGMMKLLRETDYSCPLATCRNHHNCTSLVSLEAFCTAAILPSWVSLTL